MREKISKNNTSILILKKNISKEDVKDFVKTLIRLSTLKRKC